MMSSKLHAPEYRSDIDGLRGIAVIGVVGYHAGFAGFKAGFAGVDVFFVISGYLIFGIIFRALEQGTFSYTEFYRRRINRLFPALLIVLLAVLSFGWVLLYSTEMASLAKHVVAGAAFASNFLLWSEAGYFDSADKPLLHLWSLAVEEQFYLVFPATVAFAWRRNWDVRRSLATLLAISFVSNVIAVRSGWTTAAFYFPITRFWEILAGALLCAFQLKPIHGQAVLQRNARAIREVAAWSGLALFVLTAISITQETVWPGRHAWIPVAGTLLLIASGRAASVNKFLLSRPLLVGIGLVSYPLYLWHWPLLVFARIAVEPDPGVGWRIGIVSLSLVLAWITYRFVEKPIRFDTRKHRYPVALVPLMAGVAAVSVAYGFGAIGPRVGREVTLNAEEAANDWEYPPGGGLPRAGDGIVVHEIPGDSSRSIVVLGDSHAEQYWPRFTERARELPSHGRVRFITYGGCPFLPEVNRTGIAHHGGPFRCAEFYERAMSVAMRPDVATVVLASWWEAHVRVELPAGKARLNGGLIDLAKGPLDPLERLGLDISDLRARGKNVYIVLSNPTGEEFRPSSLLPSRIPFVKEHIKTTVSHAEFLDRHRDTFKRLRQVAGTSGAKVLDPTDSICTAGTCTTIGTDGLPIYKDHNHFRAGFAKRYLTFIDVAFD